MPTYRVNQMDTKTKNWSGSRSIVAESLVAAIKAVAMSFAGMKTRRTKDGLTVKEANLRVVVTEDHSAVP